MLQSITNMTRMDVLQNLISQQGRELVWYIQYQILKYVMVFIVESIAGHPRRPNPAATQRPPGKFVTMKTLWKIK